MDRAIITVILKNTLHVSLTVHPLSGTKPSTCASLRTPASWIQAGKNVEGRCDLCVPEEKIQTPGTNLVLIQKLPAPCCPGLRTSSDLQTGTENASFSYDSWISLAMFTSNHVSLPVESICYGGVA